MNAILIEDGVTQESEMRAVLFERFTYIRVLNEEVLARSFPLHRDDIHLFLLTLPHQKVSVVLEQLLHLQPGNGPVVPVLLRQGPVHFLYGGDLVNLEAGGGGQGDGIFNGAGRSLRKIKGDRRCAEIWERLFEDTSVETL